MRPRRERTTTLPETRALQFMLDQHVSNRPAQAAGFRNHHIAVHYRRVI